MHTYSTHMLPIIAHANRHWPSVRILVRMRRYVKIAPHENRDEMGGDEGIGEGEGERKLD